MADEIKRVQVRIGSMSYSLVSAEDEQYTRQIAARADEMIRRVQQGSPQLSQAMATVLALVNAIDDLTRIYDKSKYEDQRQIEVDKQISETRQELQKQREQNWDLKKDLLELRQTCRQYEKELARWRQMGEAYQISPDDEGVMDIDVKSTDSSKDNLGVQQTFDSNDSKKPESGSERQSLADQPEVYSKKSHDEYQWNLSDADNSTELTWGTSEEIEFKASAAETSTGTSNDALNQTSTHAVNGSSTNVVNDTSTSAADISTGAPGDTVTQTSTNAVNGTSTGTSDDAVNQTSDILSDDRYRSTGALEGAGQMQAEGREAVESEKRTTSPEALEAALEHVQSRKQVKPPFASASQDEAISLSGTSIYKRDDSAYKRDDSARQAPNAHDGASTGDQEKLELGSLKQTDLDEYLLQQSKNIQKRDQNHE